MSGRLLVLLLSIGAAVAQTGPQIDGSKQSLQFANETLARLGTGLSPNTDIAPLSRQVADIFQGQGYLLKAETTYLTALQLTKDDKQARLQLLQYMAWFYQSTHIPLKAIRVLREAISERERFFGPDDPDLVEPLESLARIFESVHQLEDAEEHYRRLDALTTAHNPYANMKNSSAGIPSHCGLGSHTPIGPYELASFYARHSRITEADLLYRSALTRAEKNPNSSLGELNSALYEYVRFLEEQHRYSDVVTVLKSAIPKQESLSAAGDDFAVEHSRGWLKIYESAPVPGTTESEVPEPDSSTQQGQLELVASTSLPETQGLVQEHEPTTQPSSQNLNLAFQSAGEHNWQLVSQHAVAELDAISRLKEEDRCAASKAVAIIALQLAWEGRHPQGEALMLRILSLCEENNGESNANAIQEIRGMLLRIHFFQENWKEAESVAKKSLDLLTAAAGEDSPALLPALDQLLLLAVAQKQTAEAWNIVTRQLQIQESAVGPNHSEFLLRLTRSADALTASGDWGKGEQIWKRALELSARIETPVEHAQTLTSAASAYSRQGLISESLALLNQASEAAKQGQDLSVVIEKSRKELLSSLGASRN